jgi:hypothetical protein
MSQVLVFFADHESAELDVVLQNSTSLCIHSSFRGYTTVS